MRDVPPHCLLSARGKKKKKSSSGSRSQRNHRFKPKQRAFEEDSMDDDFTPQCTRQLKARLKRQRKPGKRRKRPAKHANKPAQVHAEHAYTLGIQERVCVLKCLSGIFSDSFIHHLSTVAQQPVVILDEATENSDRNCTNNTEVSNTIVKNLDCGKRIEQQKDKNVCAPRYDQALSKPESWTCSHCTFVNGLSAHTCEMCRTKPHCDVSQKKMKMRLPLHKRPRQAPLPGSTLDSAAGSLSHLRKTDTEPEFRRALAAEWGSHFADFLVQTNQHLHHAGTHHTSNAVSHQMKSDDLVTVLNSTEQLSQLRQRKVKITGRLAACEESNSRKALDVLMKDVQKAIAEREQDCRRQRARVPLQNKSNTLSQVTVI